MIGNFVTLVLLAPIAFGIGWLAAYGGVVLLSQLLP